MAKEKKVHNGALASHPELTLAKSFVELGNFFGARQILHKFLSSQANDQEKKAAGDLLTMTKVDPVVVLVGFGVFVFIAIVSFVVGY